MEALRALLITYAYNISGSFEDAKDIVQDVFLQFLKRDNDDINDEKSYLIRMVINRAINVKNKQKKLLSDYPGEWLPEPVATEKADSPLHREEVLSYSMMVLLEKLNPRQRAVFILKEAYDYEHTEIGEVLDITAEHSRKILSRAKKQLDNPVVRDNNVPSGYLKKYLEVIRTGDTKRLEQFLNEDITLISDGGGKATAAMKPVYGRKSVAGFLLGVYKKFYTKVRVEEVTINHQQALFYYANDKLVNCQIFSFKEGAINHMFFIRNPDKLKALQRNF